MFFSFGIVAFLVNITDIGFLVHAVYIYIPVYTQFVQNETNYEKSVTDNNTVLSHVVVKVLELVIGILVFGIGGITSCCCSNYLPQPQLDVCIPKESRSSPVKTICSFASKCAYFLCFSNFFYFSYMVGLNILPTFLMLLIAPIETLSVLVFFVSLLSSCVMVVTIVILRSEIHVHTSKKSDDKTKRCGKRCEIICSASIYFSALISIVLLVVVFLKVLASTTNSNTPYLATVILSLGSTILTVLGGYFTQQILSKENTQKRDLESGTEMSDTVNGKQNGEATAGISTETAPEEAPTATATERTPAERTPTETAPEEAPTATATERTPAERTPTETAPEEAPTATATERTPPTEKTLLIPKS